VNAVVLVRDLRRHGLLNAMLPDDSLLWHVPRKGSRLADRRRGVIRMIVRIFVEDVDFPQRTVGIGDPEFCLFRITTFNEPR
jgi:hypothetical protein